MIKNYYHDTYYPKLNIQVANTIPALVAKFIEIDDETGAEKIWDTLKYSSVAIPGEYTPPTYPELSEVLGSKLNYDFRGWSTNYHTQAEIDAMTDSQVEDLILDEETIQNVLFSNTTDNVIKLYAIYTIHAYEVTFKYNDGTVIETKRVSVVNYIPMPSTMPSMDASDLGLLEAYIFKGYTRERNSNILVQLTDDGKNIKIKPSSDLTLYASFEIVDNIRAYPTDEKYFNIAPQTGFISVKAEYKLSGKVVIPTLINNIPVTGIKGSLDPATAEGANGFYDQTEITHVFLQDPDTSQLTVIGQNGFGFRTQSQDNAIRNKLCYVELPINNRVTISNNAFYNADHLLYNIDETHAKEFFSRIGSIGQSSFASCGRYGFTAGIFILSNITSVESTAFADYWSAAPIVFGDPDSYISVSTTSFANAEGIFRTNRAVRFLATTVIIYTHDDHSTWEGYISGNVFDFPKVNNIPKVTPTFVD